VITFDEIGSVWFVKNFEEGNLEFSEETGLRGKISVVFIIVRQGIDECHDDGLERLI